MTDPQPVLAHVRPDGQFVFLASGYVLAFVFYGPLTMAVLLPFDLPNRHPAYYVAYIIGVVASIVWIHISVKQILNGCYFTLTNETLELGREPKTAIHIRAITDAIPVAYHHRLFRQPKVSTSHTRFNILLLRLSDGSRICLSPISNVQGFEKLFENLFEVLKPALREEAMFSPEDVAAMRPGRINKLQGAPKQ